MFFVVRQDGSGDKFGVSYRTIQKLFDMLNFRKAQETRSDSRQTNGTSSSQNSALPPKLTKPTGPTTASNKVTGAHKKTHSRGGSFEMSNPLMGKNSPLSTTGSVSTDTADGISPAGASPAVRSIDGVAAGIAAIDVTESEDPLQAGNDEEGESGNGFSFSVEISMMEIYNEQVRTPPCCVYVPFIGICAMCRYMTCCTRAAAVGSPTAFRSTSARVPTT